MNCQIPGHVRLNLYIAPQLQFWGYSSVQPSPVAAPSRSCEGVESLKSGHVLCSALQRSQSTYVASPSRHSRKKGWSTEHGRKGVCAATYTAVQDSSTNVTTNAANLHQHMRHNQMPLSDAGASAAGMNNGNGSSHHSGLSMLQQLRQRVASSSSSSEHSLGAASLSNGSADAQNRRTPPVASNSNSIGSNGVSSSSSLTHFSAARRQPRQTQQQQQQPPEASQQQQLSFDPSVLPIMDRVRLIRNRVAARKPRLGRGRPPSERPYFYRCSRGTSMGELGLQVLNACTAAGVGNQASSLVLDHVVKNRISGHPTNLDRFLQSYKRLERQYGQTVVLQWLKRCPPIFRNEQEVPGRLQQLRQLLGDDAPTEQAVELTRRCPMVLDVRAELLTPRLDNICKVLQRSLETDGARVLQAAPALLAMDPTTLAVKAQSLEQLAALHQPWTQAYRRTPSKARAVLLTYSLKRQMRLAYLAHTGLHGQKHSISTIMAWSELKMRQLYPSYEAWYAKHAAAAAAAEEEARAAAQDGRSTSSSSSSSRQGTDEAAAAVVLTMPVRPKPPRPMPW